MIIWCVAFSHLPHFYSLQRVGGDERDRTDDPLLAKQVLSQLSYTPKYLLKIYQTFKIKQRSNQVS